MGNVIRTKVSWDRSSGGKKSEGRTFKKHAPLDEVELPARKGWLNFKEGGIPPGGA